ncbi:MAG: hypothetical protein LBG11_10460, partial [Bifidobacteriaceae bacterium]|jgi:hypothetical protein|nr:hypothetical protein [Bifidobacteriaceae bacterium]
LALRADYRVRQAAQVTKAVNAPLSWIVLDCADPFAGTNDPIKAQPDLPVSACLVTCSALRYGDSVVWDQLLSLTPKTAPVALVVSRVPPEAWETIERDVNQRLIKHGLEHVPVFQISAVEGAAPEMLEESAVAPLRGWLERHFPLAERTADSPDVREVVRDLATRAAALASAQTVHQASVDLLRAASEAMVASAAEAAADFKPGPPDPDLTATWLSLTGPQGPLGHVDLSQEPTADQSARQAAGLAKLGQAVADAVQDSFRQVMTTARAAMVALWQGDQVPEGASALAEKRGLVQAELTAELSGSAGYGLWVEGLTARLRANNGTAAARALGAKLPPAKTRQYGTAGQSRNPAGGVLPDTLLGRTGLVALIQAAVLGVEGAADLLGRWLGPERDRVLNEGREALREARAGVARLALVLFADAVREVERAASGKLPELADRLAYAANQGQGPRARPGAASDAPQPTRGLGTGSREVDS